MDMSPDQYQTAMQTALQAIPGMCGYFWRKIFCSCGHPSVFIVVQLGWGYETVDAAEATVEVLKRDLEEMFVSMTVIVTHSSRAYWTWRASDLRALP
jgi:hypothetical protein